MYSPRYVNFYHNTFVGNSYGAYIGTTTTAGANMTNIDMKNNIFKASTSYAVYVPTAPFQHALDGTTTCTTRAATNSGLLRCRLRVTLTAWQTANSTLNANSVNQPVTFMGTDDLHLITGANNLGTPISSVTTDIDGDVRSTTTPDIGADEYTPIADDARIEDIVGASGGCGDSTIAIYVAFQNFGLEHHLDER